jgi:sugar/nucleoside kinase (ribokinase family)
MTCVDEALSFIEAEPREIRIVVMPDFFIDRIVSLDLEPAQFSSVIERVAGHKGGSVDGIAQTELGGGNAINTAYGLSNFGAKITPIICTDKFGERQLRLRLKGRNIDFSHIKLRPRASMTTALEFKAGYGKSNVMLRDVGSLIDFGPEDLTSYDYQSIREADYVCLFNWAGTKKHGTRLASEVFNEMKSKGKGRTYYDTADPRPNTEKIPELLEKVLKTHQVDVFCVNENEAITFANCLQVKHLTGTNEASFSELALESARILSRFLPARIDLHTTDFSATFSRKKETIIPAFDIHPLRATGAGDAWNAGNILADANQLSDECRLTLANAVSACYLSDPEGLRPSRKALINFLKNSHLLPSKA